MSQNARVVLDNVRAKILGDAKVLIVWIDGEVTGGVAGQLPRDVLRLAQANLSQHDFNVIVESLRAASLKVD